MLEFSHKPVMLEECMEGLSLKDGGIYFDGTVGGGGHSYEILKRTSPSGRLIATDLDDEAIAAAEERLSPFEGRYTIYKSNYKDFEKVFDRAGVEKLDGALLDFGVGYENGPNGSFDGERRAQYLYGRKACVYFQGVRRRKLCPSDCAERRKIQGDQAL